MSKFSECDGKIRKCSTLEKQIKMLKRIDDNKDDLTTQLNREINRYIQLLKQCRDKLVNLFINLQSEDNVKDKDIKRIVDVPVDKGVQSPISKEATKLSEIQKDFLDCFTYFINSFQNQFKQQVYNETNKETNIVDLEWNDNEQHEDQIKTLKHKIELIKEKYKREENDKRKLIEEYEKAIEMIEQKKKNDLDSIAKKADEKMIEEWRAIEYELNSLQSEEKNIYKKYEYLCKENLSNEKHLREKKTRCEKALERFIHEYDKDIGKKHAQYEDVIILKNIEKDKLEKLNKKFEEQKIKYQMMIEEKEIWKEKELSRKLLKLRTMLAKNTVTKFLDNYVKTLRENNISIVITKKSKGKKKK